MVGELPGEPFVSGIALGDHQQPRGILVDPVDDPRPRDPADPGELSAAMMQQRIDQRPIAVARGRVDDQPGRLFYDDQMLVLERDLQGDILRCRGGGDRLGHADAKAGSWLGLQRRLERGRAG